MSAGDFNLGAAMAGGNPSPARAAPDHEFFPTPPEAIDALMQCEGGALRRYWRLWEPCCGNGQAARALESYRFQVVGTDLIDRGYGQGSLDFLQWDGAAPSRAIVTNPPFSLADKFALKAKSLGVEYMAFLLKATYWHAAERSRLWEIWRPARIYALTFRLDFMGLGSPTMDCNWVIWDVRHAGDALYRRMNRAPGPGQGDLLGERR